jgi:cytochrome c
MSVSRISVRLPILAGLCLFSFSLLFAQGTNKNARGQKPPSSPAEASAVERGKAVYNNSCAICHYDKSSAKKIGPGLKGLSHRPKFADGKPVDDASLRVWVEKGGKDMPGFKDTLKPEQVNDLIAYLKTL